MQKKSKIYPQIEQCSDYGADGNGDHKSDAGEFNYQKNDVYFHLSYFYEEIWGTHDASISKVSP